MKRVILDTNIYGRMVIDKELDDVKKIMEKKIIVCGTDIIRKEIRKSPRWTSKYPKNLKMDLIRLYNLLVKRTIQTDSDIIRLADKYYITYTELGGRLQKESIVNDLTIVACATLHGMDIVVSEDSHTMLDKNFQKVYNIVNKISEKRSPGFLNYTEFKLMLRRLT